METDFPAAHSMDTTWYAIDAVGHVAQFDTGENGHVPERYNTSLSIYDLERRQRKLADDEWTPSDELAPQFGLFHYDYEEDYDPIGPFHQISIPEVPLHIDTLPPDFRKVWKTIQFPGLVFAQTPLIQPLELFSCSYWYDTRIAFIASDGVTVRPLRGHEHEFAKFIAEMQRDNPSEAAKYKFVVDPHV
jgi:hypothetical protein